MAQLNFDARTVQPDARPEPIPADWYPMVIESSETKPTTAGTGSYLQLGLVVTDGPHKGRKFIDRLNLNNPNPVAAEIGYGALSAICHAVNVLQVTDSSQLHGKPLSVRLGIKAADGEYDAANEVKGYKALGGGQAQGMQQQPMQQPMQQAPVQQAPVQQAQPEQQWQQPQQQQPQQQAPVQQAQPEQQWNQQPQQQQPQQQQASGAPVGGGAPTKGNDPAFPPWGQQAQ